MVKKMEKADGRSCWNKAGEDELVFVLLARDPAAGAAIEAWIEARVRLRKNQPGDTQLREAAAVASVMAEYSAKIEADRLLQAEANKLKPCPACGFNNAEVCRIMGHTYPLK